MKQTVRIDNLGDNALELINSLKRDVPSGATIVALSGELGAGKTTFSQFLGEKLGVKTQMQSPTYVIMKRYETSDPVWRELIHIDAYRLKNYAELAHLGFTKLCNTPDTLILIEWPERVPEVLTLTRATIELSYVDPDTRTMTLTWQHNTR